MNMNLKEKFENTKSTVSKKWKEANTKYPWLKPVLIGCGIGVTGGTILYLYKRDRNSGVIDNWLTSSADDIACDKLMHDGKYAGMVTNLKSDGIEFEPADGDFDSNSFKDFWEQNYKDNWDEVVECVKRLSLKPGEMFIIEDQKQFIGDPHYDKMNPDLPIVSHLVNDVGVYPPEE